MSMVGLARFKSCYAGVSRRARSRRLLLSVSEISFITFTTLTLEFLGARSSERPSRPRGHSTWPVRTSAAEFFGLRQGRGRGSHHSIQRHIGSGSYVLLLFSSPRPRH